MNKNTKSAYKHALILVITLCMLSVLIWVVHGIAQPAPLAHTNHQPFPSDTFPAPPKAKGKNPLAKTITGILFDRAHPEQSSILVHGSTGDEEIKNLSSWGKHGTITITDDTHVRLTQGKQVWVLSLGDPD